MGKTIEGQLSIFDFFNTKIDCKFSGHTCNKEVLWEVAGSLDNIECPEKCCRACTVKSCGARCNGSEEPKETVKCAEIEHCEAYPVGCGGTINPCRFGGPFHWERRKVDIRGICDDGYCPECGRSLDDLAEQCPNCNTLLDWSRWEELNKDFLKENSNGRY